MHLNPPLSRVWAKRAEPARVPAAGTDQKRVVFGAWNYRTEHFSWQIGQKKNSESFLGLLERLLAQRPPERRLVLVMDNASYHRAAKVQEFLDEHSEQIQPF